MRMPVCILVYIICFAFSSSVVLQVILLDPICLYICSTNELKLLLQWYDHYNIVAFSNHVNDFTKI